MSQPWQKLPELLLHLVPSFLRRPFRLCVLSLEACSSARSSLLGIEGHLGAKLFKRFLFRVRRLAHPTCVSRQPAPTVPNIYVMRHLHTPKGIKDPDLTTEGREHAEELAQWLSRDPPTAIYVSTTKRSAQTAAPTARRFGVNPQTYDPANTPDLIGRVLREKRTVLVIGHSNTVPDIIAGLGGTRPRELAHEDFGDIWHVQGLNRVTTSTRLSKD